MPDPSILLPDGKDLMDEIRVAIGEIVQVETNLLVSRERDNDTAASKAPNLALAGSAVATIMAIMLATYRGKLLESIARLTGSGGGAAAAD